MTFKLLARCIRRTILTATLVLLPALAFAAKPTPAKDVPAAEVVEMFAGIKSGEIEVSFIPKDATVATILFKNKTAKPLTIKLPEAFVGVPVLAQAAPAMAPKRPAAMPASPKQNMGSGFGSPMGGLMPQPAGMRVGNGLGRMMGPGMFGGLGGMGPFGGGMMMNVGPDKIIKVKVPLVCLEHGKKDPTSRVKYEIRPIESFTKSPGVIEICKMVGRGEVPQNTAQADRV